jgi:hypothetical protein
MTQETFHPPFLSRVRGSCLKEMITAAEQVSVAVTLQTCVLVVFSYNLAMETDILTDVSRDFSQVALGKFQDSRLALNLAMTA